MASQPHPEPVVIRRLTDPGEREIDELARVLVDCVDGDASVSFMHPLPHASASSFWMSVAEGVRRDERALLVAEDATGIVGTVQLVLAQPENQPHRADLSKMLVLRRARRRGIAAKLMLAAEKVAQQCGKSLLVLDTASSDAERVYERMGWIYCGTIPDYALLPRGGLCATKFYYRKLDPEPTV